MTFPRITYQTEMPASLPSSGRSCFQAWGESYPSVQIIIYIWMERKRGLTRFFEDVCHASAEEVGGVSSTGGVFLQ